jgi:hypothetical protein
MAQMAGRASVEFYVGLALKGRNEREKGKVVEDAFVIRTFRNGLGVFVSKSVQLFVFCNGLRTCFHRLTSLFSDLGLRDLSCSSGRSSSTRITIL